MSRIRELLLHHLEDLFDAETRLTEALPKMIGASHHPKLKELFEKHLVQTEKQVERLQNVFKALGEPAKRKPCKGMMGLIEEGEETIKDGNEKEPIQADLALIAAAQKVEHYEISAYGTARCLARQLQEYDCARLLSRSLGEEESSDFLLTAISDPLIQQLSLDDAGADVKLDKSEIATSSLKRKATKRAA